MLDLATRAACEHFDGAKSRVGPGLAPQQRAQASIAQVTRLNSSDLATGTAEKLRKKALCAVKQLYIAYRVLKIWRSVIEAIVLPKLPQRRMVQAACEWAIGQHQDSRKEGHDDEVWLGGNVCRCCVAGRLWWRSGH
jgi:hypothetical protein